MSRTESQAKYDAANCRRFSIKFHNRNDSQVIEKLSSVPSVQGYIRDLINADIATGKEPMPVMVTLSDATMTILSEEAEKTGRTVPDIIRLIVDEAVIRHSIRT